MLSGSGSACFGLFDEPDEAARAATAIAAATGFRSVATRTLATWPEAYRA